MPAHYYPEARERASGAPPKAAERFERYESTDGFIAVGDTDTEIIAFSGRPDKIRLTARVADALVTLTDRMDRETHEFIAVAGVPFDTWVSRDRVLARERSAGGGAELHVVGMWAERDRPA